MMSLWRLTQQALDLMLFLNSHLHQAYFNSIQALKGKPTAHNLHSSKQDNKLLNVVGTCTVKKIPLSDTVIFERTGSTLASMLL